MQVLKYYQSLKLLWTNLWALLVKLIWKKEDISTHCVDNSFEMFIYSTISPLSSNLYFYSFDTPQIAKWMSRLICFLTQISDRLQWLDWIRYSVTEFLFPPDWYNGMSYKDNFVADNEQSKILAMARLRQLRVTSRKFSIFRFHELVLIIA